MNNSALAGVIERLRHGERLTDAAIDEIARTLAALQAEGWSGFLPADRAVLALTKEINKLRAERPRVEISASWARRGLDLLFARFPDADVVFFDPQPQLEGRAEGSWWSVDLDCGKFAIWKNTGCVYRVGEHGDAADDPFLIPDGSPYPVRS